MELAQTGTKLKRNSLISKEKHSHELKTTTEAALNAGSILRIEFNRQGGPRGTQHHAEVDERAEELILDRLTEAFPEDGFLGEEMKACAHLYQWHGAVLAEDPNDGTGAFIEKGGVKNVNQYY